MNVNTGNCPPQSVNTEEGKKKSAPSKKFLGQTAFGTAFLYLTSGVFLTGLAILMGAGDVLVSYISVIANICGVLIVFLGSFMKRFRSRKKLTLVLTLLSKLLTFFIVAIPLLFPYKFQIFIFFPTVIAAFTLQAQTTVVLNNWMIAVAKDEKQGRFISLRQTIALIVTVALSFLGGYFMDWTQGKYIGFLIVFSAAFVLGMGEMIVLSRIPDVLSAPIEKGKNSFAESMKAPLKDKQYMSFILYVLLFFLLLNISDSYSMVYMMRYLQLPYKAVTLMSLIMSLPQIVLLSIWGKICDKKGSQFALKISIWLFAGQTLFFALSNSSNWFVMLPSSFLVASVANAAFSVSVFNRRYELMPLQSRIVYDNFYSGAVGLGVVLGPFLGGLLKRLFESNIAIAGLMQFSSFRLLYIVSTAGLLLLQLIFIKRKKDSDVVADNCLNANK